MIELKMYVSEVDFDAVIRQLAGTGMAGSAAVMAAGMLSDHAKEELAVKYINGNSGRIESMMEEAASRKGMHIKITGAHAEVVEK
ncbi:MAG: hypothetical protein ACI3W7_01775 [Oscillospiraceae bacterium]